MTKESKAFTTDAARDVMAERQRQISVESWSPDHDDMYSDGELAVAAACYALAACGWQQSSLWGIWPKTWSTTWLKPTVPRRDLVKAAALILAEIERMDRAAARGETP